MKFLVMLAQRAVIATSLKWPLLGSIYVRIYVLTVTALRFCARNLPIKSIYLRQGLLEKRWVPGLSDVDTLWVLSDRSPGDPRSRLIKRLTWLKWFFPFLGEAQIVRQEELAIYLRQGDAKRRTAGRWRPLLGSGIANTPPTYSPSWKWPLDCWAQAVESYQHLLARYFRDPHVSTHTDRLSARKHFLDIHRWLEWGRSPDEERPDRETLVERWQTSPRPDEIDPSWAVSLDEAVRFPAEQIPAMLRRSMLLIERTGREILQTLPANTETFQEWKSDYREDAWESQAWEKQFRQLKASTGDILQNIFQDNVGETRIVISHLPDEEEWRHFLDSLARWKQENSLMNPLSISPDSIFKLRLWCPLDGTPFSWLAFGPNETSDLARVWRISDKPLFRQQTVGTARKTEKIEPPKPVLDAFIREASANWLLNWRTLPLTAAESSALYILRQVISPALCLRLYFEKNLVGNPLDLEGMIRAGRENIGDPHNSLTTLDEFLRDGDGAKDIREWFRANTDNLESHAAVFREILSRQ